MTPLVSVEWKRKPASEKPASTSSDAFHDVAFVIVNSERGNNGHLGSFVRTGPDPYTDGYKWEDTAQGVGGHYVLCPDGKKLLSGKGGYWDVEYSASGTVDAVIFKGKFRWECREVATGVESHFPDASTHEINYANGFKCKYEFMLNAKVVVSNVPSDAHEWNGTAKLTCKEGGALTRPQPIPLDHTIKFYLKGNSPKHETLFVKATPSGLMVDIDHHNGEPVITGNTS